MTVCFSPKSAFLGVAALILAGSSIVGSDVNVRDYGAIGNGKNDDTAAIGRAFEGVSVAGGTVYFPCGTYVVTSGFEVKTSHTLVTGDRECATLKAAGNNSFIVLRIMGRGLGAAQKLVHAEQWSQIAPNLHAASGKSHQCSRRYGHH